MPTPQLPPPHNPTLDIYTHTAHVGTVQVCIFIVYKDDQELLHNKCKKCYAIGSPSYGVMGGVVWGVSFMWPHTACAMGLVEPILSVMISAQRELQTLTPTL